jgi:acyl dehydratase
VGLWFEEFEVGQVFETKTLTVERQTILDFATLTGDDNPLHTDTERMKASAYGDVIAHGLLIQSLAVGLIAELGIMEGTTIALAEINSRFVKPVLPGDEIRALMTIDEKRESSKPDRGVMIRAVDVLNQRDETTVSARMVSIMRRRPPE